MILETVVVGQLMVNCYILASSAGGRAMIIDPGADKDKIGRRLKKYNLRPEFIINTHGHIDHIGCDDDFGVPVYVHSLDAALLKDKDLNLSTFLVTGYSVKSEIKPLQEGQKICLDDIELEVIHTPGHTPGGMCLLLKKPQGNILFSGDTLFHESIGRTDFQGASGTQILKSIKEKLLVLNDQIVIYPGHGPVSTIGHEKQHNPFIV